jgi:hypothetical protein
MTIPPDAADLLRVLVILVAIAVLGVLDLIVHGRRRCSFGPSRHGAAGEHPGRRL